MIRTTEEMILSPSKWVMSSRHMKDFEKLWISESPLLSLCHAIMQQLAGLTVSCQSYRHHPSNSKIKKYKDILQTLPFPWLNACPWCISNFCSHIHIYTIHKAYKHRLCSGSLLLSISNSWQHFREFGPATVFFWSFKTDSRTRSTCVIL